MINLSFVNLIDLTDLFDFFSNNFQIQSLQTYSEIEQSKVQMSHTNRCLFRILFDYGSIWTYVMQKLHNILKIFRHIVQMNLKKEETMI